MNQVLLHEAMKLSKERKRKKRWQQVVSGMAAFVVFCTTYALILPAITMEKDPVCGQDAHEHDASCFETRTAVEMACAFQSHQHTDACRDALGNLNCGYGTVILHSHNEFCVDAEGNLLCSMPQIIAHAHGPDCYAPTSELACTLEEVPRHAHSESCYQLKTVHTCGLEETEAHSHGEGCFTPEQVVTCTVPEAEAHTHSESCFVTENEVVCGQEEIPAHTHDEDCYTAQLQIGCGLEAADPHVHGDGCYLIQSVQTCTELESETHTHGEACFLTEKLLVCPLAETEGHTHSESCNVEALVLTCPQAETEGHTHSESCIQPVQKTVCGLEETEGHTHGENCVAVENKLTCTLAESEGHIHSESCSGTVNELVCTLPEQDGHVHEETCYITEEKLVCQMQEIGLHEHGDTCYGEDGSLSCTVIPAVSHEHNAECLVQQEPEEVLICEKEIHIHSEECFSKEENASEESPYICGMGIHVHTAECKDEAESLICSIPEHSEHTAACLVEGFDETADLESQEVWEATLADVKLTGNWPTDVLAIGASQLGYTESTKNKYLDEAGKLTGYSRYGAWYGIPYGDWCAMFTSFCMHYAGVEDVPLGAGCTTWIGELTEAGVYRQAAEYTPKPGDLIFFDWEYTEGAELDSDHVGFVVELIPETEDTPARIVTLEGNSSERVEYKTYDLSDTTIIGYGQMPVGETIILKHRGEDYTVTTSFSVEAGIPEDAQLLVEEILPGTEAYDSYYSQSVAQMITQGTAATEEELAISFARFFDISFLVEGEKVEPDRRVNIQITYDEAVDKALGSDSIAVHFATEGIEILNAQTPLIEEDSNLIDTFEFAQDSFSVTGTMLVQPRAPAANYHVWIDPSNGGLMNYAGAQHRYQNVSNQLPFRLPTEAEIVGPIKYDYKLRGWYNIKTDTYHKPGEEVYINCHSVFYADWIAESYDVSTKNSTTLESVDTHEFVTTHVFDYNSLINLYSTYHTGSISSSEHSENWTFVRNTDWNNKVFRNNPERTDITLNFYFHDWDQGNSDLTYPANVDDLNDLDIDRITPGIVQYVDSVKSGRTLMDVLFEPSTAFNTDTKQGILGKYYVGEGNFLFQYMEEGTSNYDNIHNGYYYYDSRLNAASYNQTEQRFYVHNYLERTATSANETDQFQYSDFLPFNDPTVNTNGKKVVTYTDNNGKLGYQYDSEGGLNTDYWGNDTSNVVTNFHFGINTNIHFYLPNDCGYADAYGNLGNLSTNGEHMIFEFHGDDDVWVFVDNHLLLDLGGVHAALGGSIDFSRGVVITNERDGTTTTKTFQQVLGGGNILEGPHNLRFYYLERGSSMSNCAIYFNLAPRYSLELEKQDYFTGELLDGATFGVYTDESCAPGTEAELWVTHEDAKNGLPARNEFTVEGGKLKMFGLVAGTTYYIKEITQPVGYIQTDDMIRISLNNRGLSTSEVTVLRGANNVREDGFEVISNYLNEETQTVHLVITNQRDTPNDLQIRVEKKWADGSISIPKDVTVYLLANGVRSGRDVKLNEQNGWAHTWLGLADKDGEGNPIVYSVEEIGVPGYTSSVGSVHTKESMTIWTKVGIMEDGEKYMLTRNGNALVLNPDLTTFRWVSTDELLNTTHSYSYIWSVTASGDGFRIALGDYKLTLDGTNRFIATTGTGNQILHFDGSSIFGLNSNIHYELADIAGGYPQAVASTSGGGLDLELMRLDNYSGTIQLIDVTNTPIPEEQQTELAVEKLWITTEDITEKSVTIHLFADGVDTGRTLILNQSNGWKGTFDGLAMYQEDGVTPVSYTVVEDKVPNHLATYSEVVKHPGVLHTVWPIKSSFTNGKIYHLTAGGYALAVNSSNQLVMVTPNPDDPYQQWEFVKRGDVDVLCNVQTDRYLNCGTYWGGSYVEAGTNYTAVTLDANGHLFFPNLGTYLATSGTSVYSTYEYGAAASMMVYEKTEKLTADTYSVTVTNQGSTYELPQTGAAGTQSLTFGGLLMLAAALAYILISPMRRREDQI